MLVCHIGGQAASTDARLLMLTDDLLPSLYIPLTCQSPDLPYQARSPDFPYQALINSAFVYAKKPWEEASA